MSTTTQRIREMSFRVVESQIPADMTLDEYRRVRMSAASQRRSPRRRRMRLRRTERA